MVKHDNGCSGPDEGGDATDDGEDEDGRERMWFSYNCLNFGFWL